MELLVEGLLMADKLTAKQEGFVQDVFIGETLTQSYRNNYSYENMSDDALWVEASRTMGVPKVSLRLIELQEEASERSQVTVMSITEELEDARKVSKTEGQGAAMTSASMGKAKLHGLLVEKSVIDLQGKLDTKWTVEIVSSDKGK